ncbi:MAG: preprotein translocase subunit YajC [Pseudomonadota bacterium]
MSSVLVALAQQGGGGSPAGGGGYGSIVMLVAMGAIFYFLLIRPQQKRAKIHAQMLENLKKGDDVVTRGGIVGRITGIQDGMVTLEVQEKVRIRVLRPFIEGKHQSGGAKIDGATTVKS